MPVAFDPKKDPNIANVASAKKAASRVAARAAAPASKKPIAYAAPAAQAYGQPAAFVPSAPAAKPAAYVAPAVPGHSKKKYTTGYEAGDYVHTARHAAGTTANDPAWWTRVLAQVVPWVKVTFAVLALVTVLILAGGIMWSSLATIASTIINTFSHTFSHKKPCFESTTSVALECAWSERCAVAAAENLLLPCPPGRTCQVGELVSCGLDNLSVSPIVPNPDGLSCGLAPGAIVTIDNLHSRLQELTEASTCFETPSIKIRSHGSSTSNSPMFDYFDLVQDLETSGHNGFDKTMLAETPTWLEFAIKNTLAFGLQLKWTPKQGVLIELSNKSKDNRLQSHRCIARSNNVWRWTSTSWASWWPIIKWVMAMAWITVNWCPRTASLLLAVYFHKSICCLLIKTVIWIVRKACIVLWYMMTASKKAKQEEAEKAIPFAIEFLANSSNQYHRPTSVRDDVKSRMHPDNLVAQSRFFKHVWPLVANHLAKDDHVCVHRQNGAVLWKWQEA